jgi:hypothetical protein
MTSLAKRIVGVVRQVSENPDGECLERLETVLSKIGILISQIGSRDVFDLLAPRDDSFPQPSSRALGWMYSSQTTDIWFPCLSDDASKINNVARADSKR